MLRHRFVLAVVAIVVVWLAVVTVLIARQPEIGVDSPRQLQRQLATALNDRDAGALAEVLGYPAAEGDEFAKAYLARLDDVNASAITVTLLPDPRTPQVAEIRGERDAPSLGHGGEGVRTGGSSGGVSSPAATTLIPPSAGPVGANGVFRTGDAAAPPGGSPDSGSEAGTGQALAPQGSRVPFSYRLAIGHVDGSWRVEFIPPL
ncbi:hypothetical protein ABZ639_18380 [Saccharomonospora sp. NPDC006951]